MAEHTPAQETTARPLPRFYFKIAWNGLEATFQEVSGLEAETQVIEYRAGNSKTFAAVKMPGLQKVGNVTLKKGLFTGDGTRLWGMFNNITLNTVSGATLTLNLMDEAQTVMKSWTLTNAWPVKLSGTNLRQDGSEVAVEAMEFAYEEMSVSN